MSTMRLERTIGKFEESEIKHACQQALGALARVTKLNTQYKDQICTAVACLEFVLKDAKLNTIKEERIHNHEPNYSIWADE